MTGTLGRRVPGWKQSCSRPLPLNARHLATPSCPNMLASSLEAKIQQTVDSV